MCEDSESARDFSPSSWNSGRLLLSKRATVQYDLGVSVVFLDKGGGSEDRRGQMNLGHSLLHILRKALGEVDEVCITNESYTTVTNDVYILVYVETGKSGACSGVVTGSRGEGFEAAN